MVFTGRDVPDPMGRLSSANTRIITMVAMATVGMAIIVVEESPAPMASTEPVVLDLMGR